MAIPKVEWRPSPNHNARDARFPLKGDVSHRIVGSAPSALGAFAAPGGVGSNRNASSHFIVGHRNGRTATGALISDALCPECGPITGARGPLVIYQCVSLDRMAWTNGDVRDPTWSGYQAGVNPNLTTITTEHEDMASAGGHQVTDHIWRASMELKQLLRSGNLAAIRAAGIRVSDGAFSAAALVARMAALPISSATYIDHHQIAGPNKPFCWRDFDRDKGFPSRLPGLLAYLNGQEDKEDMYQFRVQEEWWAETGTRFTVNVNGTPEEKVFSGRTRVRSIAEGSGHRLVDAYWDGSKFVGFTNGEVLHVNRDAQRSLFTPIVGSRDPAAGSYGPPQEGGVAADCSVQDATIATQAQRIADLQTVLGQRDTAIVKKNGALDAAIAHEKPHADIHTTLANARKA